MRQDVLFTLRALRRRKGFTAVVVLTLALGIGANTAIFSALHGIVLQPLPYDDPDRLVYLWATDGTAGSPQLQVAPSEFFAWREQTEGAFDQLAAFMFWGYHLRSDDRPIELTAAVVTPELFPLLGVQAARGRTFTAEEAKLGHGEVALLSHRLWQSRFGGAEDLVGRTIVLDDKAHQVVGVLPAGFHFPHDQVDVWVPMAFNPDGSGFRRPILAVLGRLNSTVSLSRAGQRVNAVAARLNDDSPITSGNRGAQILSMREQQFGRIRSVLLSLFAAVAAVLMIACANVGNLLLARAVARSQELAVRKALGAGRWTLLRQPLIESLLLAVTGGAFGLLVASWGTRWFIATSPADTPRLEQVGLDPQVLLFTLIVSLTVGLIFGVLPFTQLARLQPRSLLAEGPSPGRHQGRLAATFVVGQIALALFLLVATGLLVRNMVRLQQTPAGFATENLLVTSLSLPKGKYQGHQIVTFYRRLIERLEDLPGTHSAAAVSALPMMVTTQDFSAPFTVEGRPLAAGASQPEAHVRIVSPGYSRTLGRPLLAGRPFTSQDLPGMPRVALVNRVLAERYWPAADPLGERLSLTFQGTRAYQVIGVVEDVRHYGADRAPEPEVFLALGQQPIGTLAVVARSTSDPDNFASATENAVHSLDPNLPVPAVTTMEQLQAASLTEERFHMVLLGLFAFCALAISALGIHGVISHHVARRTREIGLHMALGAQRTNVLASIFARALHLTGLGLAVGGGGLVLVAGIAETWIARFLPAISPTDPIAWLAATITLIIVSMVSSFFPARRAAMVDPMVALRSP